HHTAAAWYLPRLGRLEQARHARRRGQLHEHTLFGGQDLVGSHDLAVGDLVDEAAGVVPGLLGELPGGRVADPDRGGDGARGGDRLTLDDGGGTTGLEAEHAWGSGRHAGLGVLGVSHPVRGDVAGVAHGDAMDVGSVPQRVDDLEGRGLLALQSVGVDRVHQCDGVVDAEFAGQFQAVVEVAVDLEQTGTVDKGLGEL